MNNHYWRKSCFDALGMIGNAKPIPGREGFHDYCRLLEKGLRPQAMAAVTGFVDAIALQPLAGRMDLIRWLLPQAMGPGGHVLLPHPLTEKIVKPTLDAWLAANPSDTVVLCWRGWLRHDIADYQEALRQDPTHDEARCKVIDWILSGAEYSVHELPDGFIGDPRQVISDLEKAESLLVDSLGPERLEVYREEIEEYRRLATDYLARRAAGS